MAGCAEAALRGVGISRGDLQIMVVKAIRTVLFNPAAKEKDWNN